MTYKQLEALYWIAQLGGFAQAARRLHTTQSAISKRIAELEQFFDVVLFDRSQRSARLTEKGEELFLLAHKLLSSRDSAIEQFARPEVIQRRLRIGITELTAMTWLSTLIERVESRYPKLVIEPRVDNSPALREAVLTNELDLAFVPQAVADARAPGVEVGAVNHAWMCKPGLLDAGRRWRLHEIAQHRLLVQGNRSGTGQFYDTWVREAGASPVETIAVGNLIAIIGLVVAGLGISYLPRACVGPLVQAGSLAQLVVTPALPRVKYVALNLPGQHSAVLTSVIAMAQECCDFRTMFGGALDSAMRLGSTHTG